MTDELTPKQVRFCQEYIVDLNATQAAIRAGYAENSARQQGYENLAKPDITALVDQLKRERARRTQITADAVLSRVWDIADDIPEEDSAALKAVRVRALELLAKHMNILGELNRQQLPSRIEFVVIDPKD